MNVALWVLQGFVALLQTHRRLGESFVPALVVGVLCLGIAAGRLVSLHTEG
jgi:hypothetical protein